MSVRTLRTAARLVRDTFNAYIQDNGSRLAAALAYYTVFALPSLLVIVVTLVGIFVEPTAVEGEIADQLNAVIGPEGTRQIRTILQQIERLNTQSLVTAVLGGIVLVLSSMWAFLELQSALNTMWDLQPDPTKTTIRDWGIFLGIRGLSFVILVIVALVIILSLITSTTLTAFGERLTGRLPFGLSAYTLWLMEVFFSLTLTTVLFAAIFKVVPDARLQWRDVWIGAVFTAVLFQIGKLLIGLYISNVDVGTAFGAAGSLIILLTWIYYSTIIMYLGAEFTHVWTIHQGRPIEPSVGAVRVETSRADTRSIAPRDDYR